MLDDSSSNSLLSCTVREATAWWPHVCFQSSPMMTNEVGSFSFFASSVLFGSAAFFEAARAFLGSGAAAATFVSESAPIISGRSFADSLSALAFDDSVFDALGDFDASGVEASVAFEDSEVEASDPGAADAESSECADREFERRRQIGRGVV